MLTQRKMVLILATIILSMTALSFAAEHKQHEKSATGHEIQLSPDLKTLLNQEMAAIQQGMMDLIPVIAAGNWDAVATIGKNIKASFIMKQKLTQAQKEELHRVLPMHFVEMDQSFHKSAGMLAHAAEKKNADVVNFYFSKLNEACISCHSKFAAARFPGLAKTAEADNH